MISDRKLRQPVTINIMSKLQHSIKASNMTLRQKRLVWFTATLCLLGSFRVYEVLPVHRYTYDKTTTLMSEDVKKTTTVRKGTMMQAHNLVLTDYLRELGSGEREHLHGKKNSMTEQQSLDSGAITPQTHRLFNVLPTANQPTPRS